jgi:NTP pyrophosphatase (non-canonical NTP hydrolase)
MEIPQRSQEHGINNKEDLADELADVAMYLFELADNLKIDLPKAMAKK